MCLFFLFIPVNLHVLDTDSDRKSARRSDRRSSGIPCLEIMCSTINWAYGLGLMIGRRINLWPFSEVVDKHRCVTVSTGCPRQSQHIHSYPVKWSSYRYRFERGRTFLAPPDSEMRGKHDLHCLLTSRVPSHQYIFASNPYSPFSAVSSKPLTVDLSKKNWPQFSRYHHSNSIWCVGFHETQHH